MNLGKSHSVPTYKVLPGSITRHRSIARTDIAVSMLSGALRVPFLDQAFWRLFALPDEAWAGHGTLYFHQEARQNREGKNKGGSLLIRPGKCFIFRADDPTLYLWERAGVRGSGRTYFRAGCIGKGLAIGSLPLEKQMRSEGVRPNCRRAARKSQTRQIRNGPRKGTRRQHRNDITGSGRPENWACQLKLRLSNFHYSDYIVEMFLLHLLLRTHKPWL